jgi:peptidoglycan/LPS O-acetylase OafA/YrhL
MKDKYISTLPKKGNILFIKFQLILIIFLTNNIICGIKINLKQYLLSMIFKSCIGNSNWFAFTIICLYYFSFFSFILIKNKNYIFIGIIINSIICFFFTILVYKFYYIKKKYAVDNIFCFVIGLYYSLLKKYLNDFFMNNDIIFLGSLLIFIIIFYLINKINLLFISIQNCLFCIIIALITMKVRFKNEFLKFLNNHSYSIYLLQRVVMIFVYNNNLFINSFFIRFFFIFTTTLFLSSIFDKYTFFINKFFLKVANNNNKKKKKITNRKNMKIIKEYE